MKKQQGMTLVSWAAVLAIVGFVGSAVFKMLPHYLDYMSIDKAILSVETDAARSVDNVRDFYSMLNKNMQVNGIRDLRLEDALTATQDGQQLLVHLNYERREPLVKNLDLVARFNKEYRLRLP